MKKKILLIGLILSVLVLGGCTQYKDSCDKNNYNKRFNHNCLENISKNICKDRNMLYEQTRTSGLVESEYSYNAKCMDSKTRIAKSLRLSREEHDRCLIDNFRCICE